MELNIKSFCQVLLYSALLPLNIQAFSFTLPQDQLPIHSDAEVLKTGLSEVISSSPLLSFHKKLVEIESIINNEHEVGAFLVHYLQSHNFSVLPQEVDQEDKDKPSRYNILALSPGGNPETAKIQTILTTHIDTVPPYIPYNLSAPSTSAFRRQDIRISGRGSVDAKACVATQIHAVLDLLKDSAIDPNDVGLLFVVGEEGQGDGMRTFSKSFMNTKAVYKTVIFGEPTELKLAAGHKGMLQGTVKAKGVSYQFYKLDRHRVATIFTPSSPAGSYAHKEMLTPRGYASFADYIPRKRLIQATLGWANLQTP